MKPMDIMKARSLKKTSVLAKILTQANAAKTAEAAVDEYALNELETYIENESELYEQKVHILKNMARKIQKGTYDSDFAVKSWLHWVDLGAKRYLKEIESDIKFPKELRVVLARQVAQEEAKRIKSGEYDEMFKDKSVAPADEIAPEAKPIEPVTPGEDKNDLLEGLTGLKNPRESKEYKMLKKKK